MPEFEDLSCHLEQFTGTVRLFPLPNLVLFPHVIQPLHVFEARYRRMLEDALATDRLIAMAVLRPGWEGNYEGRPPVYPYGCLGWVATHHRLSDGTYNLLLLGMRRVHLLGEQTLAKPYRVAKVELVEDRLPADEHVETQWKRRLHSALFRVLPMLGQCDEEEEYLEHLLESTLSLGALTDMLSYLLDLPIHNKHALLAEGDVVRRARRVLRHLKRLDQRAARAEQVRRSLSFFSPN